MKACTPCWKTPTRRPAAGGRRSGDDGAFMSEYARDHPRREDFAESFGPWFALRYLPDRLTVEERWAIATTMPNRLAYFDEQGFDMSPYTVRGSALRVHGMSPFQP